MLTDAHLGQHAHRYTRSSPVYSLRWQEDSTRCILVNLVMEEDSARCILVNLVLGTVPGLQ